MFPVEYLWPPPQRVALGDMFDAPAGIAPQQGWPADWLADEPVAAHVRPGGLPLTWRIDPSMGHGDASVLTIGQSGVTIRAGGDAGLIYALHTLGQVLSRFRRMGRWQAMTITDRPDLPVRGVMLDLGRTVYSLPMLQRVVRLMNRLKLNQLHLHLYDDELCGLRFEEGLPFGSENPYALTLAELAELVGYASERQVEIVPELEGWGHVGALTWHRPDLLGGDGVYNGASFIIGQPALALMEQLITQVARVMPMQATIHLGLDEAKWYPAPDLPADYTPSDLIADYHAMLQRVGDKLGKRLGMRVWADHGGRPIPAHLVEQVIVEPWQYWHKHADDIADKVARYTADTRQPWMIGGGTSGGQYRGSYLATRQWCREARRQGSANLLGVNLTMWLSNDLEGRFTSLFAGAALAWNALPAGHDYMDESDMELFDRKLFPLLYAWRGLHPDTQPEALLADRGPLVHAGFHVYGPRHGQPAAPTAPAAGTQGGHDYVAEVAHAGQTSAEPV